MSAVPVRSPQSAGSMSVDSWIHWHPSSLLFTCYLGVPPLAESFCSDSVVLSVFSGGSGTDPLRHLHSPRPSLSYLGAEMRSRTVRDKANADLASDNMSNVSA